MNLAATPAFFCDCTYMLHEPSITSSALRTRSKTVKNCEFLGNWLGTLTYQRYSKIHCTIPVKTFKIHNWIVKKPIHLSSWHKCVFWESIFRSQHFLGPHFPLNKKKRNPDRTKEAVDDSAEKQTSSELHYQEFGRSCSRWCRQTLSVSGDKAARSSMIWKLFSYTFMYFHVFRILTEINQRLRSISSLDFGDIIWHNEGMTCVGGSPINSQKIHLLLNTTSPRSTNFSKNLGSPPMAQPRIFKNLGHPQRAQPRHLKNLGPHPTHQSKNFQNLSPHQIAQPKQFGPLPKAPAKDFSNPGPPPKSPAKTFQKFGPSPNTPVKEFWKPEPPPNCPPKTTCAPPKCTSQRFFKTWATSKELSQGISKIWALTRHTKLPSQNNLGPSQRHQPKIFQTLAHPQRAP